MALSDWFKSFQNVSEVRAPVNLRIRKGALPSALRGTYFKASPGEFHKYGIPVAHPFDGDGYVSAFRFDDDGVQFQSRFVNTYHRQVEERLRRRVFMGAFGTPPITPFVKNPANTSVIEWGGYILVFCESGPPYLLDPKTLETRGVLQPFREGLPIRSGVQFVDNLLRGLGVFGDAVCAHPKVVRCGGGNADVLVLYSISYQGENSVITFFELNEKFEILHTTSHEVANTLYFVHDFQVSDDYYFFVEHSVNFDWNKVKASGLVNSIGINPSKPYNILHAVPRRPAREGGRMGGDGGGDYGGGHGLQKEVLPGMVTHFAGLPKKVGSAYVFKNILYESKIIEWNTIDKGGRLYEITWNMENNDIRQDAVADHFMEFPVVSAAGTLFANVGIYHRQGLVAIHDNKTTKKYWFIAEREFMSEPVVAGDFVMVVKYNAGIHDSVLLVFDANDISTGPLCEIETPAAMPIGLHGWWSAAKLT